MIRKAVPEDMDIVYKLISELEECEFPESEFKQIYDEILNSRQHCVFLYEKNSKGMGLLHLRLENQLHHCGRTAEIIELIIEESHRSEGIGRSLINAAFKYAVKQNCKIIEVTSNRKRTAAHRFYQKNDMELTHFKFTTDTDKFSLYNLGFDLSLIHISEPTRH